MVLRYGTTTCEVKTGYELTVESELLQLKLIASYQDTFSPDLMPTFLGAHAVPPEYKGDAWGYTNLITSRILSEIVEHWKLEFPPENHCHLWMSFANAAHSTLNKAAASWKLQKRLDSR